jgi:hypothetical protein
MAKKPDRTSTQGKGEIVLYQSPDGKTSLEVRLDGDTLWLSQKQLSDLFQTERSVITKHLGNIFRSGDLERNSVCAKFVRLLFTILMPSSLSATGSTPSAAP